MGKEKVNLDFVGHSFTIFLSRTCDVLSLYKRTFSPLFLNFKKCYNYVIY